jgi:heat shock protein HspQ
MDRTLYNFQIGDIVSHRMYPDQNGVVIDVKISRRNSREWVHICWFDEGPNSEKRYPQSHIVKVS